MSGPVFTVDPVASAFRECNPGVPVPATITDRWKGAGDGEPETVQKPLTHNYKGVPTGIYHGRKPRVDGPKRQAA